MIVDRQGLLSIQASHIIGESVAVLGIKGSGKSNTAAVLMEELLKAGVPICVVDIAGEYHTLKDDYPNVAVVGVSIETNVDVCLSLSNAQQIAELAYANGSPVVIDISGVPAESRDELLHSYFTAIWRVSAVMRIPLVIFLEEAHNWVPQRGTSPLKNTFIDIASEGRKRGLSLVLVGQRSARIDKDTLTQAGIAFLHKVRHPTDLKVYTEIIPRPRRWVIERVNKLKTGVALVLIGDKVIRSEIRLRETRHVGDTPSLSAVPQQQLSLLELLGSES